MILGDAREALRNTRPFDIDDNPLFDGIRPYANCLAACDVLRPGFLDALSTLVRALTHRDVGYCPIVEGLRNPRASTSSAVVRNFPPTRESAIQTDPRDEPVKPSTSTAAVQTSSPSRSPLGTRASGLSGLRCEARSQGPASPPPVATTTRPSEPPTAEQLPSTPVPSSQTVPRGQRATQDSVTSAPRRPTTRKRSKPSRKGNRPAAEPTPTPAGSNAQPQAKDYRDRSLQAPRAADDPEGHLPPYGHCFNCWGAGHARQECTEPPGIFCFRCGWRGETVRTCPTHARAYAREGRGRGRGSRSKDPSASRE